MHLPHQYYIHQRRITDGKTPGTILVCHMDSETAATFDDAFDDASCFINSITWQLGEIGTNLLYDILWDPSDVAPPRSLT
jgi:hypothetical protein